MGRQKALGPGEAGADGRAACVCCGKRGRVKRAAHDYGMLRGICLSCRATMRRMVARGRTTWAELERKGLILPPRKDGVRQVQILGRLGRVMAAAPAGAAPALPDGGERVRTALLAVLRVNGEKSRTPELAGYIRRLAELVKKAE